MCVVYVWGGLDTHDISLNAVVYGTCIQVYRPVAKGWGAEWAVPPRKIRVLPDGGSLWVVQGHCATVRSQNSNTRPKNRNSYALQRGSQRLLNAGVHKILLISLMVSISNIILQ